MSVRNCPVCGRIFEDMGVREACSGCFAEYEKEITKVKDYLYQNPNKSIVEVSAATGISIEKLKRFINNERLVAVEKASQ